MAAERNNPETGTQERRCEDCSRWLGLYEFPTSNRTWVCKVCQGLKAPPKQKPQSSTNYQEYLDQLAAADDGLEQLEIEYRERRRVLIKGRKEIVKAYYTRLGKVVPMGRPSKD